MDRYTFWYKKTIQAKSLEQAVKIEKKTRLELHQIEKHDRNDNELTPMIGFQTYTESDYWE